MRKGTILHNITIEKLVFGGKGFARNYDDNKVIFITWGAIPEAIVDIKIIKKRRDYYEAQIVNIVKKSPFETELYPHLPGAPWVNISYEKQLEIKQQQLEEAFFHIQKFQKNIPFLPIIPAVQQFWYRNKIEFSFGKYISHKEDVFEEFHIGFHKRGEFSKVLDFEDCFLIDEEQNKIYAKVREFTKESGYSVYDQKIWTGFWRHFMMRKMYFSWEILLVFSLNPEFFPKGDKKLQSALDEIYCFIEKLWQTFPAIKSVYISHNTNSSDTLIWNLECVYGRATISENILWYSFDIWPQSFFQTNSQGAEVLYRLVKDFFLASPLNKQEGKIQQNTSIILDLYAGTGTIGMLFSDIAKKVISVELVKEASENGRNNAQKNGITNMEFVNVKVEEFLESYLNKWQRADLLIIDPPRAGMHPSALPNILKFKTRQILYVSCNPATLARDSEYILKNSDYTIEKVQAVDMFPHTHHIETVVSFVQKTSE